MIQHLRPSDPIAGFARLCGLVLALMASGPSLALELIIPFSSQLTTRVMTAPDSYALPTGTVTDGQFPSLILEGQVERQVFRIPGQALTTLQILAPLRSQLEAAGYEILLDCHAAACGGFDFRFATEVLPAPDMYVDLTDFRFLTARRGAGDHIGLLVSASANAGFIQMIRVTSGEGAAALRVIGPSDASEGTPPTAPDPQNAEEPVPAPVQTAPTVAVTPFTLADSLRLQGHVILSDLSFPTGSSELSEGRYDTLETLAAFLLSDPTRRIALVGHTDAVGALEGNIALSRQRAASVRQRLISVHNVPASQVDAEGMGYLSPIAANTTPEGREANRRVEAVLLNTD